MTEEVAAGPAGERPTRLAVPEAVRVAAAALEPRLAERPVVALVLGSGLGDLADEVEDATWVPAAELPGMPVPKVPGHAGAVVAGRLAGVPVLVLAGRVHTYEGYSAAEVAFGTRVAAAPKNSSGIAVGTSARNSTRACMLQAQPHKREPTRKMPVPAKNTRLRP